MARRMSREVKAKYATDTAINPSAVPCPTSTRITIPMATVEMTTITPEMGDDIESLRTLTKSQLTVAPIRNGQEVLQTPESESV